MEYFCYISRSKIDQLFASIEDMNVDEWQETQTTEHDIGTKIGADLSIAKIVSIFKGEITYGRKGVVQRERKIKIQYVEKLQKVLMHLAKKQPIPDFIKALQTNELDSIYYHYSGSFRVREPITEPKSNSVVTLESKALSEDLHLDCSLRFFSESNEPDGSFLLHSTNSSFFSGAISLNFATAFILLGKNESSIVGTPLYLKLTIDPNDWFMAL
jgi:hypothetical protein